MNCRTCSRLAILSALSIVSAALPKPPPEWHVSSLNVKITINPDSSLLVDETQVIPENPDRNFGVRCEIPIGDNDRWDRNYGPGYTDDNGLRVKVQSATVDGQPVAFHLDHYRRTYYQLIVDKSVDPGKHALNVIYRVTGAVRSVGSDDELYWNIAGNILPISYDSLTAHVILPPGVPADAVETSSYAGGRGVSNARRNSDPPIETTKFSDGVEFAILDVHLHQSLSLVMRWPQGYVRHSTFLERNGVLYPLGPLLLLAVYISARHYLRRNVVQYSTTPQYQPPAGLSPAALRYVMRGVVDGTSVAAGLASLAVKGYVEVQAKGTSFAFGRTPKCDTGLNELPAEEAALAQLLFDPTANVADPACGRTNDFQDLLGQDLSAINSPAKPVASTVAFGPADPRINVLVGTIYSRVKPQLEGKYFTWNSGIVFLGMLATLIFGITVFLSSDQPGHMFLAMWTFFFLQVVTAVIGMTMLGRQRKPVTAILVSLAFLGCASFAAREVARDISWLRVASYFAMIIVNGLFVSLMRTPTAKGQKILSQIRGYKIFLQETELDHLKELGRTPSSMPKLASLPYAIALDLQEPWGNSLANTVASATTSV
jgi:hypothetical membrane protein